MAEAKKCPSPRQTHIKAAADCEYIDGVYQQVAGRIDNGDTQP